MVAYFFKLQSFLLQLLNKKIIEIYFYKHYINNNNVLFVFIYLLLYIFLCVNI